MLLSLVGVREKELMRVELLASGVLILLAVAHCCHAWSYNASSTYGPTRWSATFSQCDAAFGPQSPITFTATDRSSIVNAANPPQLVFNRILSSTADVIFTTGMNTGGLIVSQPLAAFPVRVQRRNSGGIVVSSTTMYLLEIAFHSGIEHQGAIGASASMEIQYSFSSTVGGTPSLVFVQIAQSSSAALELFDWSATRLILSSVAGYASSTSQGAHSFTTINATTPFLFLNSSASYGVRSVSIGTSTTYPPCTPVEMVVSTSPVLVLASIVSAVYTAGNAVATTRPTQDRSAVATLNALNVYQSFAVSAAGAPLYTPQPTQYVDVTTVRYTPNPHNEYMMDAIIGLVALNGVLIVGIVLLLLARWEIIEWPTWAGGLRQPVEWWTNPQSAAVEFSDEEDEEDGEEGEEEEEEEEDGADVVSS